MMSTPPLLTIAMALCSRSSSFVLHAANALPAASFIAAGGAAFNPMLQRCRRHPTNHYLRSGCLLRQSPHPLSVIHYSRSVFQRMMVDNEDEVDQFIYTSLDDNNDSSSNSNQNVCQRDLQQVLHTIEKAAYAAGQIALSTAGQIAVKSTKANARDLVTESDVECQRLIEEIILTEFPNDAFLGEEGIDLSGDSSIASSDALRNALGIAKEESSSGNEEDRLLFVVDPIDGTTNFQAGLPIYAMSIGVVSLAGSTPEVVAGVIYNPTLGEMTSAVRGRGCYLNNKRINPIRTNNQQQQTQPRQSSILSQSLINVGFPISKESTLLVSSRAVTALATKVRGLRMVACASQTMAWVAHSKLSSYFSWDLNAWDIAAGMVIVEESGGLVSNFDGTKADISSRDMIITCCPESSGEEGLLRDELIEVLRDNDCVNY